MRTNSQDAASAPRRPTRARLAQTATAGVLLLGLAGCSSPAATATGPAATPSGSANPTSAGPPRESVAAPVHDNGGSALAAPAPAAVARARVAMIAFCRPTLARTAWMVGLDPSLTLAAAQAYATVDPKRVACTRLTGPARLGDGDAFTQLVTVPTDAGDYRVTVTRAWASERWLVFAITPTAAR